MKKILISVYLLSSLYSFGAVSLVRISELPSTNSSSTNDLMAIVAQPFTSNADTKRITVQQFLDSVIKPAIVTTNLYVSNIFTTNIVVGTNNVVLGPIETPKVTYALSTNLLGASPLSVLDSNTVATPSLITSNSLTGLGVGTNYIKGLVVDTNFSVVGGFYDIRTFGAVADGVTDTTTNIQNAINFVSTLTNGSKVYIPSGRFRVDGSLIVSNISRLTFEGNGMDSILYRNGTVTPANEMLLFTGCEQLQIKNIRFEQDTSPTNTLHTLVRLHNLSDPLIMGNWFFGGGTNVFLDHVTNARFTKNGIEASKWDGLLLLQSCNATIEGNFFFRNGAIDANPDIASASLRIENDPTYVTIPNQNFNIVNNYFVMSEYSHFAWITNANAVNIVGNFFSVAGMLDPHTKDCIRIYSSTNVSITANSHFGGYNPYSAGDVGTRWVINLADNYSEKVNIMGNAFEPGNWGTINYAVTPPTSTIILNDRALFQQPITAFTNIFANGGGAGDITSPAVRVLANRFISLLDANGGYTGASGFRVNTNDNSLDIVVQNSTLHGANVSSNGWSIGTVNKYGKLTVGGAGVFIGNMLGGSNLKLTLGDNGSEVLSQSAGWPWLWYDSGNSLRQMTLSTNGALAVRGTISGAFVKPLNASASTLVETDGTTNLVSVANSDGLLANNGSGGLSWTRLLAGANITFTPSIVGANTNIIIDAIAPGASTNIYSFTSPLFLSGTNVSINANGIDDTLFRQSAGVSVVGRANNSVGNVADIVASADNKVLMRTGGALSFTDYPDDLSIQKIYVTKGGLGIGTRKQLNFIEGANTTITMADNSGANRVDVMISASGSVPTTTRGIQYWHPTGWTNYVGDPGNTTNFTAIAVDGGTMQITLPTSGTFEIEAHVPLRFNGSYDGIVRFKNDTTASWDSPYYYIDATSMGNANYINMKSFITTTTINNVITVYAADLGLTYTSTYITGTPWISYLRVQ